MAAEDKSNLGIFRVTIFEFVDFVASILKEAKGNGESLPDPLAAVVVRAFLVTRKTDYMAMVFLTTAQSQLESIRNKEQKFLVEKADILFPSIPESLRVKTIQFLNHKCRDGSMLFSGDDLEYLWQYSHSLVEYALKWVLEERIANPKCMPEITIDLRETAVKWKILPA